MAKITTTGSRRFSACPTAFPRTTRSATSSPGSTPWRSSAASPLGSRPSAKRPDLNHIAIDGKALRGSLDRAHAQPPLHLVSAWATANHLTLGQVAVDQKSNEI